MTLSTEHNTLSHLADVLELEYLGALPLGTAREVVTQTARAFGRRDGSPIPLEAVESAAKRSLVGLITVPDQRVSLP